MRREVSAPLSNEKVTYIEFQGDLWLFTFPKCLLAFHIPKVTLGVSLLNSSKNMKTLHIPHFCILHKNICILLMRIKSLVI